MSNPLAPLVAGTRAHQCEQMAYRDATVTTASPLTITIDGDTAAITPTKAPLVAGLVAGDRVGCLQVGKTLVVLGRYGG